jgi:hypothetical protein
MKNHLFFPLSFLPFFNRQSFWYYFDPPRSQTQLCSAGDPKLMDDEMECGAQLCRAGDQKPMDDGMECEA